MVVKKAFNPMDKATDYCAQMNDGRNDFSLA